MLEISHFRYDYFLKRVWMSNTHFTDPPVSYIYSVIIMIMVTFMLSLRLKLLNSCLRNVVWLKMTSSK